MVCPVLRVQLAQFPRQQPLRPSRRVSAPPLWTLVALEALQRLRVLPEGMPELVMRLRQTRWDVVMAARQGKEIASQEVARSYAETAVGIAQILELLPQRRRSA